MAAITSIIAAVGLGISAVGMGVQMNASKKAADASVKAEQLRKKQMNLDAAKERREMIRQAIIARSTALANTTSAGAGGGGSSALGGAYAGIANQTGHGLRYNYNSQGIGAGIFDANAQGARASGMSGFGSGITGLGGMITDNASTFKRVGTYYGSRMGF